MKITDYLKLRFSNELTHKDKLEKAYELIRRNIVLFAKTRDLTTDKKVKQDITDCIIQMKLSKKSIKRLIEKENGKTK